MPKTLSDLLKENPTLSFDPFPVRVVITPWDSGMVQGRIEEWEGSLRVKTMHGPYTGDWGRVMPWLEGVLSDKYPYVSGVLWPSLSALVRVFSDEEDFV